MIEPSTRPLQEYRPAQGELFAFTRQLPTLTFGPEDERLLSQSPRANAQRH